MMFKRMRIWLLPLIWIIVEWLAAIGISVAATGMSAWLWWPVFILYGLLTVWFWSVLFRFRQLQSAKTSAQRRNIVFICFVGILIVKLMLAVFVFLDELRRGLVLLLLTIDHSVLPIPYSVWWIRIGLIIGLVLWLSLFWGTRNKYRYQIRRLKLKFDHFPAAFRGLRIVQISDIHSGSFQNENAVAHGIDLILKEQPDLILFTGDLVNNRAVEIVPYMNLFKRLKAPMGVYSILGNHDYGDYVSWPSDEAKQENLEDLKRHHADMGWQLLMNEHRVFSRGSESIALIGIENWGAKGRFPKYGRMSEAYHGLEADKPSFKILMSHDPSHWDAEVRPKYPDIDLTLSGHTHGMQFGVRLGGKWQWSPVRFMYKQWAGLYKIGRQYLYVNVGFGFLGYPGRLGMRPEITVFELT